MKLKSILFLLLFGISSFSYAETQSIEQLNKKMVSQQNIIANQKKDIQYLIKLNKDRKKEINALIASNQEIRKKLHLAEQKFEDGLSTVQQETHQSISSLEERVEPTLNETQKLSANVNDLGQTVAKHQQDVAQHQWIYSFSLAGLAVLLILLGVLFGKKLAKNKNDVENLVRKTKTQLEEESLKIDEKLIAILDSKLKVQQESAVNFEKNSEPDHSLALKVADEIIRIQKNLHQMDEKTRGLKQLTASVKRIQDNFAANGYELVDMLGKEYNEGMKVVANFVPSDELETGKQIITRIIKPQVNFKGEMIQAAQIEVSVGE